MQILKWTYKVFPDWVQWLSEVPDHRVKNRCQYQIEHILFLGILLFITRSRSLRSFVIDHKSSLESLKNFKQWIAIKHIPTDDELRYVLQTISTRTLNRILKLMHQVLERKKIIIDKLLNQFELVSMDGTGQLASFKIACEKCLTRNLSATGEVLFMHGQLLLSLTDPKGLYSLPLQFEPIERSDTETEYSKNDCELNAAKRLIEKLKPQFPKRSFCFLGDNLFAVEPITKQILEKGWHFIFTAKPERNQELFLMYEYVYEKKKTFECTIKNKKDPTQTGNTLKYSWSNGLPIKQAKFKEDVLQVNLLNFEEINPQGEIVYKSSWMTDIPIDEQNVQQLAKAARARFAIENRNFNEQKNLGFNTEHNFGHKGNLPNVFFGLAQIAQLISELFSFWKPAKAWIKEAGSKRRYFEKLGVLLCSVIFMDPFDPIIYLKFEFDSS